MSLYQLVMWITLSDFMVVVVLVIMAMKMEFLPSVSIEGLI